MSHAEPWRRAAAGAGLLGADGSLATTIFAEITALAVSTGALNLGQGFPDDDGPAQVLDAAREAIATGANQYPPARGVSALREAIAAHQHRFYGLDVDPDTEVLVTMGATEALTATLLAFVEPGDEVVVLEPYYDSYAAIIALASGVLRPVPLRFPDFRPDPDELRTAVTDRTRIILINTPHNPTGMVLNRDELELIVDLAHQHDALIVADEVYEHLTFDASHLSPTHLPGGKERTVSISSAGKTFSVTGWKIGWLTAPASLVSAILAVKQYLTFAGGSPFQPAIAAGLALPDEWFARTRANLQARRNLLAHGLRSAGFDVALPQAGYFIVADASTLGVTDGAALCRSLPSDAGVAAIPLTAFARPERTDLAPLIRFAHCKRVDVLREACTKLAEWAHRVTA
ncbi:aminotransferase class I/II-fold pyridoxal phosphate-dependent enzyme [Tessaracoccus caeni]|uniref:aminotransferase class I/II-fold pyridoxal phosphate-dependent enzyme n=1 Tax=Tessaracoccus caeni TaxID=3031239 RepID=UPI0023DBE71D|nr:aminotransferase class I/II-fold pyridoxal phosphate-dependent enzyme [Tessaracoccus caeni]MDF1487406.1 aminotransferase class I/II-fold pyridoxal phosphate-dependent enzyme [Tessaracoccus caeni]